MRKIDWGMVRAITAIIALLLTTLFTIFFNWSNLQPVISWLITNWPLILLLVMLFLVLIMILFKWQGIVAALKPKPRLTIAIRDTICLIETAFGEDSASLRWRVSVAVEIANRGRATANDITGTVRLFFGRDRDAFQVTKNLSSSFNLEVRSLLSVIVDFPRVDVSQVGFIPYPNSPYRLDLTYSCAERSRERKVKARGELVKADWLWEYKRHNESLQMLRMLGFDTRLE